MQLFLIFVVHLIIHNFFKARYYIIQYFYCYIFDVPLICIYFAYQLLSILMFCLFAKLLVSHLFIFIFFSLFFFPCCQACEEISKNSQMDDYPFYIYHGEEDVISLLHILSSHLNLCYILCAISFLL